MYLYVIISIIVLDLVHCQKEAILATLRNIPEDGLLNFTQLANKYGHRSEEYDVTTEDGYILGLFNLPGDRRRPVLLTHGVFDTADGWIIRGNTSLAIILANVGYDVWVMNFRGNRYARRHDSLNPDTDSKFWDFSAHEYGVYDLPASIDYVLNVTRQQRLSIVGFSEGTTATFILGSLKVEYNDKVKVFVALAPVVFLENVRSTLSVVIQVSPFLNYVLPASIKEVTGFYSLTKALINLLCAQLVIGYELCYQGGLNVISGLGTLGIDKKFFPVVIGHFPAGSSRKNLIHFAQISLRRSFAQYDYGTSKNLKLYRTITPPVYDVTRVTMRTVLVSGQNDAVSTIKDVKILENKLPNVEKFKVVERDTYNHLDHLWARDAYKVEYPFVLDVLDKYN